MSSFDSSEIRKRYEKLEDEFPARCRRLGTCVEISKRVETLMVGYAKETGVDETVDPLPERAKMLGRQIGRLCPNGQLVNGVCGIIKGNS